jgi:hypothetical protein
MYERALATTSIQLSAGLWIAAASITLPLRRRHVTSALK